MGDLLHPSLCPKYTNDPIPSSNYSSLSFEETISSQIPLHKNYNELSHSSAKLIFENMDKFETKSSSQNDAFNLIEDSFDYDSEFNININSDYYLTENEYDDSDYDELSLQTHLIPPSLNLNRLSIENETESVYDEDGDHDISIPQEFRNLSVRNCDNATFDFSYSTISEDEDSKHSMFDFGIESVTKYKCNDIIPSLYDQKSYEIEDEDGFISPQNTKMEEKHFDFTLHPNEIRLSEQACIHLIDLVEYQTDCDDIE